MVNISAINSSDIGQIIQVHMKSFPNFFLTFLGPAFLREFYDSFVVDSEGVGFVARDGKSGRIVGVVVGPFNPSGYFRRLLKRRWWAFCVAGFKAVLKQPSVISRLFRAVFYRGDASSGCQNFSLLSSIAVDPDYQSRSVGRKLAETFLNEIRNRGGKGVFLTTDEQNNDKVNRFYIGLGFRPENSYSTPEGRRMNRYVMEF